MGWVFAALLVLPLSGPLPADQSLPSRALPAASVVVDGAEPASFDLIDWREEQRRRLAVVIPDSPAHSVFGFKRHVGFAAGYDNDIVHGSVGLYLTVAEWGRWNFGVPSPEVGFGRYTVFDARRRVYEPRTDYTIIISLVSVHYRAGHLRSWGMNWYVTVEQIFDVRANMPGSQIGISLSRK
jgi:hypothetical protein